MKIDLLFILVFILSLIFQIYLNVSLDNALLTSIVISLIPYLILQTKRAMDEEKKEENFIRFAMDLADLLRTGLTLPIALNHLEKADYGPLNPLIRNLSARIDWGVGTIEAFNKFAQESESRSVSLIVKNIINIYTSGGSLVESLEASVRAVRDIKKLRKQRESVLHENILHSYIVFFFFLATSVILIIFLLPFLDLSLPGEKVAINSSEIVNNLYLISIIQSFFAGLALGKMYKGSYRYGLKHSLIFLTLTLIIFKLLLPLIPKGAIIVDIASMGNI
ncbi:hypothetical protein BA065_00740 [Nanoarchaeota archaeon NZ13-N]|uniref:Type II secretion system protein GspF domain-containing protein n=1 Tax=Candidatus Nanoclepta minutus TaxID=1940235 RepID=A0A397WNF2_9ARCH|nr:MAG: hypothetical protein BA065_00740 [Nanoarchaeota archaeon NZ13-N]RIB35079.1 MAG: hypothetical protein BXU00_03425 [Candidatus Nanoclepta minutus]